MSEDPPRPAALVKCLGSDQQTLPLLCCWPHSQAPEEQGCFMDRYCTERLWGPEGKFHSPRITIGGPAPGGRQQGPLQMSCKSTLQCPSSQTFFPFLLTDCSREAKLGLSSDQGGSEFGHAPALSFTPRRGSFPLATCFPP